jgi:hypothetical protein
MAPIASSHAAAAFAPARAAFASAAAARIAAFSSLLNTSFMIPAFGGGG